MVLDLPETWSQRVVGQLILHLERIFFDNTANGSQISQSSQMT
jgi:hypothetical protein